jgi:hypothetical protein
MSDAARGNLPHTFRCFNHPEREGVGICVGCRSVVCVECSTKIEGMNYCIGCLRSAADPARVERPVNVALEVRLGIPLLAGAFLLTAAVFAAMGWLLAWVRSWSSGGVGG